MIVSGLNHYAHQTKTKYTFRDFKADADGNVTSEKLVYFKDNAKERLLYDQAVSEPLIDGQLSIYGHGNSKYIQFDLNAALSSNHLLTADYTLYNDSSMYRNFVNNGGTLTMNFKSCHTGLGNQNIAQQLSQYRSGLSIHAANDYWKYNGTIQNNAGYNQFINGVKVGWDLKR